MRLAVHWDTKESLLSTHYIEEYKELQLYIVSWSVTLNLAEKGLLMDNGTNNEDLLYVEVQSWCWIATSKVLLQQKFWRCVKAGLGQWGFLQGFTLGQLGFYPWMLRAVLSSTTCGRTISEILTSSDTHRDCQSVTLSGSGVRHQYLTASQHNLSQRPTLRSWVSHGLLCEGLDC